MLGVASVVAVVVKSGSDSGGAMVTSGEHSGPSVVATVVAVVTVVPMSLAMTVRQWCL